jgi:hypothetical protein
MHKKLVLSLLCSAFLAVALITSCGDRQRTPEDADYIRQLEKERLSALVDADIETANRLHADDFQLFMPDGTEYNKEAYLSRIASGKLNYRMWDPGTIRVRMYDGAAVIRYDDARFEVFVDGKLERSSLLRHTNLYERRSGLWQLVWSHTSGGQ